MIHKFLLIWLCWLTFCWSMPHDNSREPEQRQVLWNSLRPFVFMTTTQMRTVTQTKATSQASFCAKLVNISGTCSIVRGQWETPIILTFDDGMDELDHLIQPTNVNSMETTDKPREASFTTRRLESSVTQSTTEAVPETKIFFHQLSGIFRNPFRTITRVSILSTTITSYITTQESTKTFFMQNCIPAQFTYRLCTGTTV